MPDFSPSSAHSFFSGQWGPWTVAGGPDPDFDDSTRTVHHVLLTDPELLTHFRRRFPEREFVCYDEMVRLLGWVWDCPRDGTANVLGYRCATCQATRASVDEPACLDAATRTRQRPRRWPAVPRKR
jgi:hypothetical protein